MATSHHRYAVPANTVVNLYCAQCESQLGIFDNEWIRLTTSYARSKEKGTHFGTEVGHRTQVVPIGPAQRLAEGCVMAEVFCRKCSNMVGQYCKSAPDAEKQPLVEQYFYKLSRTFLKDSRSMAKVEPVFGYGSDMMKSAAAQSSIVARGSAAPASRWANTPLRQSSSTPVTLDLKRRESQGSPSVAAEQTDDKWERSFAEIQKLRDEMRLQRSTIQEQSNNLTAQTQRLDDQDARLSQQVATIDEHESCQSAQATRIVEQDVMIKEQTRCLEEQQSQMTAITNQLVKLQKTMDDLRTILDDPKRSATKRLSTQSQQARNIGNMDSMEATMRSAQNNAKELEALRAENESMKSKLNTIANAMGVTVSVAASEDSAPRDPTPITQQATQTLGKRKRNKTSGGLSVSLEEANASFRANPDQMPTPQSSDGGRPSPEQTPSTTNRGKTNRRKAGGSSKSAGLVNIEHATPNLDIPAQQISIEDSVLEHGNDEELRGTSHEQLSKLREDDSSAAAKRGRGRPRKSQPLKEVADVDDEAQTSLSPEETRRITRSTTKAAEPKVTQSVAPGSEAVEFDAHEIEDADFLDVGHDDFGQFVENEDVQPQPTSSMLLSASSNDFVDPANADRSFHDVNLPTVQMASSVLGVNLGALIASSQALRQSLNFQETARRDLVTDTDVEMSAADEVRGQPTHMGLPIASQEPMSDFHLGTIPPVSGFQQIDFVEDPSVYDPIDSSDDDDDLMQPDAILYGDDSLMDTSIVRQDRSMAPEPIRPKKPTVVPTYAIDLDTRIHVATPDMFTKAYAAGRRPRLTRVGGLPTRERILNEELTQLGLAEWIGKQKNTKEYRDAVTAARARSRNLKKAAFLKTLGLNHNPAEPASTLPEGPVLTRSVPLSEIENVPSPATQQQEPNDAPQITSNSNDGENSTKEQSRTTRASTRRTSAPLVAGLNVAEDQSTEKSTKPASQKRKSVGRRQSQRRSAISLIEQEVHAAFDLVDDGETVVAGSQPSGELPGNQMIQVDSSHQSVPDKNRVSRKAMDLPRQSTASEPPSSMLGDDLAGNATDMHGPRASTQAPVASITKLGTGNSVYEQAKAKVPTSPASQARQREEAIVLRDQMAKQLMELDDMDL